MKGDPEQRALLLGEYIVEHGAPCGRQRGPSAAASPPYTKTCRCGCGRVGPELFRQVQMVLARNKAERHLRGGAATREKYHKPR